MKRIEYKGSYLSYFLMYMFYYFGMALFSALISVYLMDKGYTASQVSVAVSLSLIMSMIVQPIVGNLNDRYNRKLVNGAALSIAALMGILFILSDSYIGISAVYAVGVASLGATNPVIERLATTSRHKYSAIRIWGTIGYATGSQVGGIIYSYISPDSMYIFFFIAMLLCIVGLTGTREDRLVEVKKAEKKKLVLTKEFVLYLVIACLFYGMTNLNGIYIPSMYQSRGLSVDQSSLILFLGTMTELPVILLSGLFMNRLSNKCLLKLVFVFLLIQFGAYSFCSILPIQIAATILTKSSVTMAFIMINIKVIATVVDSGHQMTALALVSTVKSLVCIGFQMIGGYIIDHSSFRMLYTILFICAVLAFAITSISKLSDNKDLKLFS